MVSKPFLLMTLLVRDEIDIIDAQIKHHLNSGVDHFIVTDNGSLDGTREYLEKLVQEGYITLIHEPSHTHDQGAWVSRMARVAARDFSADWIIHSDADEFFWTGKDGNDLKDFFADIPQHVGVVRVRRYNILKDPLCNTGDCLQDNRIGNIGANDGINPKVCHRPALNPTVAEGNHRVSGVDGAVLERPNGLTILHFPYRSYEQYEKKIVNGARALLNNPDIPENIGSHWRVAYQQFLDGNLPSVYNSMHITMAQRDPRIASGKAFLLEGFGDWCLKHGLRCNS